jgi:hypothetical protein
MERFFGGHDMDVTLSSIEKATLLAWYETAKSRAGRLGDGGAAFPEEERLVSDLTGHAGGAFEVNQSRLNIMLSWAESAVDAHFGGGAITNPDEAALLDKLKRVLQSFEETTETPSIDPKTAIDHPAVRARPGAARRLPKYLIIILSLAALILLVLALLFQSGPDTRRRAAPSAPDETAAYRVESITGNVFRETESGLEKVSLNQVLKPGERLCTGRASEVVLKNNSGNKIKIAENTEIKLE